MNGLAQGIVFLWVVGIILILRLCRMSEADIRRLVEAHVPDYARIERLERELFGEGSAE